MQLFQITAVLQSALASGVLGKSFFSSAASLLAQKPGTTTADGQQLKTSHC